MGDMRQSCSAATTKRLLLRLIQHSWLVASLHPTARHR